MSEAGVKKSPVAVIVIAAVVGPALTLALVAWVLSGFADYERVATGFVQDAAAGRFEAAHRRMAAPYRESVALPRFAASL